MATSSGIYAGTQSANAALVDRAARTVIVDYLPVKLEALALAKKSGAPSLACERLAQFAATVRTVQAQSGGESRPFSFRRLLAFMNATARDKIALDNSWRLAVLSRLPEADRETMRQAIRAHFDGGAFNRELNGAALELQRAGERGRVASARTNRRAQRVRQFLIRSRQGFPKC